MFIAAMQKLKIDQVHHIHQILNNWTTNSDIQITVTEQIVTSMQSNVQMKCSPVHTCVAPVSASNIGEYDPLTAPPVESRGEAWTRTKSSSCLVWREGALHMKGSRER